MFVNNEDKSVNYLERELFHLIKTDPNIFAFLQTEALDGVWFWDLEQPENEWMDERFWAILGYDASEKAHLAKEWQELIHPDDMVAVQANFASHCEDSNCPYDQIVRYRTRQGGQVWVRCRGYAIRDQQGKPIRMLGIHTDVTALKLAEQSLLEHNRDLTQLSEIALEAAPNAMIMVNREGKILLCNKATEQLFGYSREELTNQPIDILVPDSIRKQHPALFASFFKAPATRAMGSGRDLVGQCKDKRMIPVEIGLNPIANPNGDLVIASIVDISERKQHEREIARYTLELERSNKELDSFAYAASHDIKAPLRGILQLAGWIQQDLENKLDRQTEQYLTLMQNRIQRMESLLDGLLAYSRLGCEKYGELSVVDVNAVGHEIFNLSAPPAHFRLQCADDLPVFKTMSAPFEMVLRNLIGNAIKHRCKDEGVIRIAAEDYGDYLEFKVYDDGVAIPKQYHENIFKIFQTLKPRDEVEGSGLGLAMVKKTLAQFNCEVSLSTGNGTGNCFTFTWPCEAKIKALLQ